MARCTHLDLVKVTELPAVIVPPGLAPEWIGTERFGPTG